MLEEVLKQVVGCAACHTRIGVTMVRALPDGPAGSTWLACPSCGTLQAWSGPVRLQVDRTTVVLQRLGSQCHNCGIVSVLFHTDGMVMSQYWYCPVVECQAPNLTELPGEIWRVDQERQ
jgi:hypothetical protein